VEIAIGELTPMGDDAGLVLVDMRVRNQDGGLVARLLVDVLWRRTAQGGDEEPPASADDAASEFVPIPL
jgi:hypothetical protein